MTSLEIVLSGYLAFGQLLPTGQVEIVKHAGLQVLHADGAVTLRLKETGRTETAEPGGRLVRIDLQDETRPFFMTRFIRTWNDCDVVETWVEIRHSESGAVRLVRADSFAAPIACSAKTVKVLSLTGTWAYEANLAEAPVANGQIVELLSRSGVRDAWESNAAMMVSFDEVTEDEGKVLGLALAWTGTTSRRVRRDWNGSTTEVFAGVDMTTGPYVLDAGKTFRAPRALLVWSEKGRGEVSRQLHRWARNHCLPHGRDLHPILLNSWEGSYFSFTEKTLTDMMDGVKELGGEMFVLDDGWFGRGAYARDEKNRDTVGLGDWYVNPAKLPHGLGSLADEAAKRGLKFGLWVEPEMVNTKSHLAESHPDWLLREEGRPLALGRGGTQTVLDYTNPAVRDHIYESLDAVFASVPSLAYVKWDANQNIVNPGSTHLPADRQSNLWYDYTVGLYDLLAKLQAKRPHIIVQACASGGGHMDYGFLRYADEFWTSDDTDAYQRIFIQWGTSQFYPASAMACHVTKVPNEQTKRVVPLKYRFDVAMCGRLGFELHPKDLKKDEVDFAKRAVVDYRRIRPVVQLGDLYRLASPYENPYSALMYVSESKDRAVLFVLGLDKPGEIIAKIVPRGLDPDASYTVREINCGARPHSTNGYDVTLSGPYDSAVFEFVLTPSEKMPPKGRTDKGLKVRFLGTGAADWNGRDKRGELRRLTSILVENGVLVDFTSTARDMIPEGVQPKTIFYTHSHGDHYQPLDALKLGVTRVYTHASWADDARKEFAAAAAKLGVAAPEVKGLSFGEKATEGGVTFTALAANHRTRRANELAAMYLIEKDGTRLLYATDTAGLMGTAAALAGIDAHIPDSPGITALIMEATMGVGHADDYRIFQHSSVDTVAQTVRVLSETKRYLPRPGQKVYLTHMARTLHGTQAEIETVVPAPLCPAYDGLEVVFN